MSARGWIGVDLDGTLAFYEHKDEWDGSIGEPIPAMVERVRAWLRQGIEVRIVTARVSSVEGVTDGPREVDAQRQLVAEWCLKHIGRALKVTAAKDYHMRELWDDRAVQVVCNTGLPVR